MSTSESDKNIGSHKITTTTMDLPPKMALVKPNDKGITTLPVQPHQTFRATIGQQQMRVVTVPALPAGSAPTSNLLQTHIIPQAILKQVDTLGNRTIQTVPARSITQTSITVSRPLTPVSYMPRCQTTVTNIHTARGAMTTPIRNSTQSSATVANITPTFVRTTVPPRTSSPATTVLAQGTTWMPGSNSVQVQLPAHLIRANIGQTNRSTRVVTATSSNNATITANVLTSQQAAHLMPQSQVQQSVTGAQSGGPSQTFVATLAAVLPPRPQTATLVYSNNVTNSQQYNTNTVQKLPVTIGTARQVRPIQRIPAANLRVSTASISIRAPSVPVLAPASVLTTIPNTGQARAVATGSGNIVSSNNAIPTRIIQVQPQSGRVQGNVMALPQNIVINATRNIKTQIQPSLTISHVGKIGQQSTATLSVNSSGVVTSCANVISSNNLVSPNTSITSHTSASNFGNLQHLQSGNTTTIVSGTLQGHIQHQQNQQSQQLAQLVSVNSSNQTHQLVTVSQHQLIPTQNSSGGITTVVPLSSITRNANTTHIPVNVTTLSAQNSGHIPVNVNNITAQNATNTINLVSSSTGNTATLVRSVSSTGTSGGTSTITTIPPIAKVLPQQQHITSEIIHHHQQPHQIQHNSQIHTGGTPIYIHARTSNTGAITNTIQQTSTIGSSGAATSTVSTATILAANAATFIPASGSNLVSTIPYTPSASSFAVVPTTNRSIGTIHSIIPTITNSNQLQAVPVRFNPMIVDGTQTQIHHIPNSSVANVKTVGGNVISVMPSNSQIASSLSNTIAQQATTQHMIPKIIAAIATPRPSILRKRDIEGSPVKGRQAVTSALVTLSNAPSNNTNNSNQIIHFNDRIEIREKRDISPVSRCESTDGSTTVSVTSSPGLDQQEQEEQDIAFNNRLKAEYQFKTVEEFTPATIPSQVTHLTAQALSQHQLQQQIATTTAPSNSNGDVAPRKKARKQQLSNENTLNVQFNPSANANNCSQNNNSNANISSTSGGGVISMSANTSVISQDQTDNTYFGQNKLNNNSVKSKDIQPAEVTVKKPQTVSLLQCYKQNWKAANNHFQRYSDIRPRDERRPSVMDLANQAHVLQKVNGWKIFHLSAQIEDLCELESQAYDKLALMLESMEAHESNSDVERASDLLKGNMQRSKIIIDGINDARSQIMKIFDHKPNVSDIIHRCASKRNFKKREKNTTT